MAQRIWGIDLGSHSVKVCRLQSGYRTVELTDFQVARVEEDPEQPTGLAARIRALQSLVGEKPVRPEAVVVALPGNAAATHFLSLPFTDTRRLEQTLGFEVESQIPFDLSEVVYDYQVLDGAKGVRSDLLVGVVKKTAFEELLLALASVGLDPRLVTLPSLPLLFVAPPSSGADAILDFGHRRVTFLLRDSGNVSFARTLEGGGAPLTAAVAKALSVDLGEAERIKESRGTLDETADPELAPILRRVMSPLIREMRQTLKLVASKGRPPIQQLYVTGGGSRLKGLEPFLSAELGVPVASLPLVFPGSGPLAPQAQPVAALSLGLALQGHGGGRLSRFNLRRGDQSFQGDLAKLRKRLTRVGALAASLLLLFALKSYAQMFVLSQREQKLDQAICNTTKQAVGKCVKDVSVAKSLLAGGPNFASAIPENSALNLLAEVATRLDVPGAKVTEMDIGPDQVELRGEADSFETVDKVVAALKSFRCFQDIQRGRIQRVRDGAGIEYNLGIRIACPGGAP
jgi:general secretion pathway protein L